MPRAADFASSFMSGAGGTDCRGCEPPRFASRATGLPTSRADAGLLLRDVFEGFFEAAAAFLFLCLLDFAMMLRPRSGRSPCDRRQAPMARGRRLTKIMTEPSSNFEDLSSHLCT